MLLKSPEEPDFDGAGPVHLTGLKMGLAALPRAGWGIKLL
jgi:hypothetical protein